MKVLLLLTSLCFITSIHGETVAEENVASIHSDYTSEVKTAKVAKDEETVKVPSEKEKNLKSKKDIEGDTAKSNSKKSENYPDEDELVVISKKMIIDPLKESDNTIAGLTLGKEVPEAYNEQKDSLGNKVLYRKGPFITYGTEKNNYTVYEGPAYGMETHSGVRYQLEPNTVVQIHIEDKKYKTKRGLAVKDPRGLTTYKYGIPANILQNPDTKKLIYVYGKSDVQNEKMQTASILAVTMDKLKVGSIDVFAPSVWENGPWPRVENQKATRGVLTERDFILGGYRINEYFLPAKGIDEEWGLIGTFWHKPYVANDRLSVNYTEDHHISKVLVNAGDTVTSRGVGIGSGKILLYLNYGVPYKIVRDFSFKEEPTDVCFEYKNPKAYSEYLLFVVGENGFVKSVILSDRSAEQIQIVKKSKKEKELENFLLYHNVPTGGIDSLR